MNEVEAIKVKETPINNQRKLQLEQLVADGVEEAVFDLFRENIYSRLSHTIN